MDIFNKIDSIRVNVDSFARKQTISDEVTSRNNRYENTLSAEKNNLLRVMATLIAYSNNAQSDAVRYKVERGTLERVFCNFELDKVASMNPGVIIEKEWDNIKCIRFKKKVDAIVTCAKLLIKNGKEKANIESLYKNYNLPKDINNDEDIVKFWEQFDNIYANYKKSDMPYFKNDTTLLHLLLHLGFPCIKPDLIVMKVAASLGIVKGRENHNTYSSDEKKLVVRTIQRYCLSRNIKPAVMDLYILIYGGQKDALRYVATGYVPLLS